MLNRNPITKHGLFATPSGFDAVENMINGLPKELRMVGYTVAGMTWNLAAETVDKAMDKSYHDNIGGLDTISDTDLNEE